MVALNVEPGGQQTVVQLTAGPAVRGVQEQAGRDPGGGVGQLRAEVSQNRNQYNRHCRAGDHLGHTGQHRERREAKPLDGVAPDDQRTQRHKEHTVPEQILAAHGNDVDFLGGVEEQRHDLHVGKVQDQRRADAVDQNDQHGAVHTLANAVHAGRAEVLTRISRHGRADALQRDGQQVLGLAAGCDSGHRRAAQHIDGPLHDNAADGCDAALQAHRHTDAQQTHTGLFREGQIVLFHFQHVEFSAEINKAQDAGDDLRNISCQRRAEHAEVERHDKQKVKADVQCAGQNQKVKRRLAVAQRAHDGRHHIVQKDKRDARKDPADVDDRAVNDVVGRLHQLHHRAGQCNGADGQHHTGRNAEPGGVGNMAAQVLIVPRAEQLCYRNRKAVADADDEAQNQIVDRAGSADRGQRTDTAEPAHDDGIRQRIELLEQVAQHQRQGEQENNFERAAARKVFCHDFPYPIIYVQNFVRIVL